MHEYGCYDDYDYHIKVLKEKRDNLIKKYFNKKKQIIINYSEDIEEIKRELKECLSSKGNSFNEI